MTAKKTSGIGTFLGCVLLTLGAGTLSGFLSGAMRGYEGINTPDFTLPDWSFSVIWTILYVMIGISLYLLLTCKPLSDTEHKLRIIAITLWAIQFALNLLWPFIFFNIDYTVAFVINVAMVAFVTSLVTIGFFIRPLSSIMLLPYWLWLLFSTYLTLMIIVLNV